MRRIAVVMGTRPEAIKLAPVVRALEASGSMKPLVVSTGQHDDMLKQVIHVFDVSLDADLAVMRPDQTLAELSGRLLERVDGWLGEAEPDFVLVQGDTTTVLMTALACFYRRIPVGHVEAGLRTGSMTSPFPEEANRKLAAPLMSLHFPPTDGARQNLLGEGVEDANIVVTGNTVIDALQLEVSRQKDDDVRRRIGRRLEDLLGEGWDRTTYVLVTGHRRESFGERFRQICRGLAQVAEKYPHVRIVYPVHLNPNVRGPVHELLGDWGNIFLLPPLGYPDFVALMAGSTLILTDSGGIQEEAPSLGKPVLVMRDTTERPEGVKAGTARIIGADAERIARNVSLLLDDPGIRREMARARNPYGDGRAAERIVRRLREFFGD